MIGVTDCHLQIWPHPPHYITPDDIIGTRMILLNHQQHLYKNIMWSNNKIPEYNRIYIIAEEVGDCLGTTKIC